MFSTINFLPATKKNTDGSHADLLGSNVMHLVFSALKTTFYRVPKLSQMRSRCVVAFADGATNRTLSAYANEPTSHFIIKQSTADNRSA